MLAQRDLVEIIAKFSPKVVRMAESDENKKGRED
jgi:hypothetical protein